MSSFWQSEWMSCAKEPNFGSLQSKLLNRQQFYLFVNNEQTIFECSTLLVMVIQVNLLYASVQWKKIIRIFNGNHRLSLRNEVHIYSIVSICSIVNWSIKMKHPNLICFYCSSPGAFISSINYYLILKKSFFFSNKRVYGSLNRYCCSSSPIKIDD